MIARARTPLVLALLLGFGFAAALPSAGQENGRARSAERAARPVATPAPADGPATLAEAQRLTVRATELYQRGLYDQAEPLYARALAIRESQLSDDKALPVAV